MWISILHYNFCSGFAERSVRQYRKEPGLDLVSVDLIRNYFRKAREYERAYREGHQAGMEVKMPLKQYKSHRCMRLNFYICTVQSSKYML